MIEHRDFSILNRNQNPINPENDLSIKFLDYDPNHPDKKERKITKADIRDYVQDTLQMCKKLLAEKQDTVALAYVVESFVPEVLFDTISLKKESIEELKRDTNVALASLREAILQEIKIQLDNNEEFAELKTNDIFLSVFDAPGRNIVQKMTNAKRENYFLKQIVEFKTTPDINNKMMQNRKEFLKLAQQDELSGKGSPYILLPEAISPDNSNFLTPALKMIEIDSLLCTVERKKDLYQADLKDFQIGIKAITDFARGCQYIQSKGFVLMDIDRYNIGYDLENQRGVVYDLDSLAPIGSMIEIRINKVELYADIPFRPTVEAVPGEMVFQLGVTLKDFVHLGLSAFFDNKPVFQIFSRLDELCLAMINFNSPTSFGNYRKIEPQPVLDKVIEELDKVLQELNQLSNV